MKGLIHSFRYAFRGIWECIRGERNFRIHLSIAIAVLSTGTLAGFNGSEIAALCSTISLVLFAEMANTAIERVVDIRTPTYHEYAKAAKDLAAGAVLICALLAMVTAAALFLEDGVMARLMKTFAASPLWIALYIIYTVLAVLFVFFGGRKNESNE